MRDGIVLFPFFAVWWIAATIPLLKTYKQKHYIARQPKAVQNSFKRLGITLKNVRTEKKIFLFLLAFFFYIDGVYTIIDMATAYGTALGLDSTGLLLALLVTQLVAFPFAILFGRLSNRYDTEKMILICIAAYFGLMDICGKGASFLGTIVISLVSQLTGQVNIGVGAISLFFILDMIVFKMSTAETTSM